MKGIQMMAGKNQDDVYGEDFGPLFEQNNDAIFTQSQFRPTPMEKLVAELIAQHKGREHPISNRRLQELTHLSERDVKDIVEVLVCQHQARIGGRRGNPCGYFLVVDAEDLKMAVKPYRSQIRRMAQRLRVLEGREAVVELLGQMRLEVERD